MSALVQITAPHFCAGVLVSERAAPIVHYMARWSIDQIETYCRRKGWACESVPMEDLARAIEMSSRVVEAIDYPETMTSIDRVRLILSRDALVRCLSPEDLRLFRLWASQERPS